MFSGSLFITIFSIRGIHKTFHLTYHPDFNTSFVFHIWSSVEVRNHLRDVYTSMRLELKLTTFRAPASTGVSPPPQESPAIPADQ
jgi:hypothetical protein